MASPSAVPGLSRPGFASPGDPGASVSGLPAPINQWQATFSQPSEFGPMPPALQSTVVALNPDTSVGSGSGYPSEGSWLFCIAGWQQVSAASPVTVGDADDIHSWWRPAQVSTASGVTRTSVWYTPNLARVPQDVYVAPNGCMAGTAVLVVEVADLGDWDEVIGVYANYAGAATSLNLALSAPGAQVFAIAAVCGDNDAASQGFAPAGWTPLQTVVASNGVDHTADAVLTSACITTSSALSVNATASTEDLSGVIVSVAVNAPSPIPEDWDNPGWPGRTIFEVALGAGFQTPQDEYEWTVLSDSATRTDPVPRL